MTQRGLHCLSVQCELSQHGELHKVVKLLQHFSNPAENQDLRTWAVCVSQGDGLDLQYPGGGGAAGVRDVIM